MFCFWKWKTPSGTRRCDGVRGRRLWRRLEFTEVDSRPRRVKLQVVLRGWSLTTPVLVRPTCCLSGVAADAGASASRDGLDLEGAGDGDVLGLVEAAVDGVEHDVDGAIGADVAIQVAREGPGGVGALHGTSLKSEAVRLALGGMPMRARCSTRNSAMKCPFGQGRVDLFKNGERVASRGKRRVDSPRIRLRERGLARRASALRPGVVLRR